MPVTASRPAPPRTATLRPATLRHRLGVVVLGSALVLGLSACSDDEPAAKSSESPATSAAPGSSSAASPTSEPTEAGDNTRSRAALDQLVEANRSMLGTQKEAMKEVYSDITVEAQGDDTLLIRYVLAAQAPAEAAEALQSEANPAVESLRTTVLPQMETAGVDEPKVRYVVENPDGKVVYDETISQ
ncbi:hypothetical protein [Nocardioides yefusunii]|uniref:Lipoprotein n=1 Tax=Nocardioides yefusunii TaxID=2500546 RepID=A0ABW1QTI3_9ACTN|nr:hypothetical protein [Nocardioides yefusunii]